MPAQLSSIPIDSQQTLGRLTAEKNALSADISGKKNDAANLDERVAELTDKISEYHVTRSDLKENIAVKGKELKILQADIDMFPTEISEFVKQGGQNIKTYWKFAWAPLLLLAGVTLLLLTNAANLTTVYDENETINIWSIFVTRLPYVMIASGIIFASATLIKIFIGEIMRINQQRLNLSKISIIAKDVSMSAEDGLELSDYDIHELRTNVKMSMLRDHLKEYLSEDYSYVGLPTPPNTENGDDEVIRENLQDDEFDEGDDTKNKSP